MTRSTLRMLLWLASALVIGAWFVLAWRALASHAAPDAVEAAILDHAARLTPDAAPYGEPAPGDVPMMPLVPLAVAWLQHTFGDGVWAPRALTLLATLITAALAGSIVAGETQSATLGAAASALLLMGQGLALAAARGRVEPAMLLLAVLGCQALRYGGGVPGALLAAVTFGAACFTHPAGLWFALAALLHLGVREQGRFIAYGLGLALVLGLGHWQLLQTAGPWYVWAAWDAGMQAMRFQPLALLRYVGTQLLGALGVFTLATVLSFALPIRPWHGAVGLWTWMAFAAVAAGAVATQGAGAPGEAMRFAAVTLAIVGPVSVQRITQHLSNWPGGSRMGGQAVVLTALALQFVTLLAGPVSR